jgi:hypothetical protein
VEMTQGVTQGVTDCQIRQYDSYIYSPYDPNGLAQSNVHLRLSHNAPRTDFKPPSHRSAYHYVGWHAVVCYGCPRMVPDNRKPPLRMYEI